MGTLQTIGTSVGVVIVGVLFFSTLEQNATDDAAAIHGLALAHATGYNLLAGAVSLLLFAYAVVLYPARARRQAKP